MNVSSILNGDSPSEEPKYDTLSSSVRPPVRQVPLSMVLKHSINELLNDLPSTQGPHTPTGSKSDRDDHYDDVDSAAEMIDRELEIQSEREAEEQKVRAECEKRELEKAFVGKEKESRGKAGKGSAGKKTEYKKSGPLRKADIKSSSRLDTKSGLGLDLKAETKPATKPELKPDVKREVKSEMKTKSILDPKPNSALVLKDLKQLTELKKKKWKPHRYTEPPIWAQEYVSPMNQDKLAFYQQRPTMSASAGRPVFDRSSMFSGDLECLITGIIPPQSTVRRVAEWIYANFVEILVENRQYVELELKFGTIVDKTTDKRLALAVSSECIYTDTSSVRYELSIHEAGWRELRAFMDELETQHQEEHRRDPSKPRKKFAITETENTDFFYTHAERNEKPQSIRITKEQLLTPPRYEGIYKRRLSDIHVFNPSSMFDFRLSLSLEIPVPEGSMEPIMKKNKPHLQRHKKRMSFTHAPTVTKFDFTEVAEPKTPRKTGKPNTAASTYELELEIDTFLIFRGFDKVRDGLDAIRFEELVEVFLNNARCCNNRVTKFASS